MLEMVTRIRQAAADCADAPVWGLSDTELTGCLDQAWAGIQALTAVAAHLIRQAESRGLPASQGASSTVVWLRQRQRMSPSAAARLVRLAAALDHQPVLDAAVSSGSVSTEQAEAIAGCVADLPADAGPQVRRDAEDLLVGWAEQFDARALGRLGTRILTHVAPDLADQRDGEALRRQEARAYRSRGLTLSPLGDGSVRLTGRLDAAGAATVHAALDPLCHPRHDTGGTRTPAQRRADALVDVCALALRTTDLPAHAGDPAQVVVTIPVTDLIDRPPQATAAPHHPGRNNRSAPRRRRSTAGGSTPGGSTPAGNASSTRPRSSVCAERGKGTGTSDSPAENPQDDSATRQTEQPDSRPHPSAEDDQTNTRSHRGIGWLDTGLPISAAEARRLACDAHILPAVLGTDGQVLDLGRARRLITGPLRRALILRDGGCSFPGCDRPARWCDGHHIVAWADGGTTDLANACLVCAYHHRLLHHSDWQVRLAADGRPEFIPPDTVDPQRQPRRNLYHCRQ